MTESSRLVSSKKRQQKNSSTQNFSGRIRFGFLHCNLPEKSRDSPRWSRRTQIQDCSSTTRPCTWTSMRLQTESTVYWSIWWSHDSFVRDESSALYSYTQERIVRYISTELVNISSLHGRVGGGGGYKIEVNVKVNVDCCLRIGCCNKGKKDRIVLVRSGQVKWRNKWRKRIVRYA